jgi:uncharacterized protein YukE
MPAGNGFVTDTQTMYDAGVRIFTVVEQLRATATTMSNQLTAELNDATFAGAASNAFGKTEQDGVHGLLKTDMTALNAALDELQRRVGEAVQEYSGKDLEAEQAVSRSGAQGGQARASLNWG